MAKITAQADKDKETSHDERDTEEVNGKEEENEDWEEEDKNRLEVLVKNNNHYKCVSTDKLKFLDIANFIAPVFLTPSILLLLMWRSRENCSLRVVTSLDKRDVYHFPNREALFSSLKNKHISGEDYAY